MGPSRWPWSSQQWPAQIAPYKERQQKQHRHKKPIITTQYPHTLSLLSQPRGYGPRTGFVGKTLGYGKRLDYSAPSQWRLRSRAAPLHCDVACDTAFVHRDGERKRVCVSARDASQVLAMSYATPTSCPVVMSHTYPAPGPASCTRMHSVRPVAELSYSFAGPPQYDPSANHLKTNR